MDASGDDRTSFCIEIITVVICDAIKVQPKCVSEKRVGAKLIASARREWGINFGAFLSLCAVGIFHRGSRPRNSVRNLRPKRVSHDNPDNKHKDNTRV